MQFLRGPGVSGVAGDVGTQAVGFAPDLFGKVPGLLEAVRVGKTSAHRLKRQNLPSSEQEPAEHSVMQRLYEGCMGLAV